MRHLIVLLVSAFMACAPLAHVAMAQDAAETVVPVEDRVAPAMETPDPYVIDQKVDAAADTTAEQMREDVQEAADLEEGHNEAAKGGLPQFDATWFPSQIFWLVVTFAVLFVVLSKSILPALGQTLDTRRAKLEDDLKAAESLSAQARTLHDTVQRGIHAAQSEAVSILAQAGQTISAETAQRQAVFQEKAQSQMDGLQKTLDKASKKARTDMEGHIADLVSDVLGKTAGVKMAGKDIQTMLNRDDKSEAA